MVTGYWLLVGTGLNRCPSFTGYSLSGARGHRTSTGGGFPTPPVARLFVAAPAIMVTSIWGFCAQSRRGSTVVACVRRRVEHGRAHRRKGIAHFLRRVGLSISAHVSLVHPVVLISCRRRVSGQNDQAALHPAAAETFRRFCGGQPRPRVVTRRRLRRHAAMQDRRRTLG